MSTRQVQRDLLEPILTHAPVGVALLTADDLTYEYVNPAYQAIGSERQMLGRRYADVWPEVADQLVPLVHQVVETGEPWIGENLPLEIRREPGLPAEVVYFTFVVSRLMIGGEPHVLTTVYEVTREVETRRRIERERALLQAVLEAMTEAVIISDSDANVLDMNAEALRLTGFENVEQVRRDLRAWPEYELRTLEGDMLPVEEWPLGRVTRGETFTDQVLRVLIRATGEERLWSYSGAPVFEDGTLVRTVLTVKDVTEEHAAGEALREQARFGGSMAEISVDLASSLDIEETLPRVLKRACEELGGIGSVVADRVEGGWRIRHLLGIRAPGLERGAIFAEEQTPTLSRIVRTREPYVVSEVAEAEDVDRESAQRVGFRAYAAYPLVVRNEIVGALTVFFRQPRSLSEQELDYLRRVAFAVSLAEENFRLYEAERERARLNEGLAAIDQSIHGPLSADEMLHRVVVAAAEALGCESSALDLREDEYWVVRYVYLFPEETVGRRFTDEEVPFAALASRTQQPVVIDDAFTDPRVDPEIQRAYDVRSVMVTPLVVRDEVIGVLFFNYHEHFHTFTKAEIDFARRLSSSLGLAITNERLFEAEHHVAETLQTAMLAVPERIRGIEFAHAYRSAAEAALVGGDFYDVFEMGQELVGITVGDVAGKGLDASVLTSLAKNAIRAHASEKGATPMKILELTNEVVFQETQGESFVTVFFGVLDREDGRLVYSSAGHTTGALVAVDGTVTQMPSTGPVIGAFSSMRLDEAEVRLDLDESLFLYTDGLTEARRDDELFGEQRLFALLAEVKNGKPAKTVRSVIEEVLRFAGGRLNDDLAVLAVKRLRSIEEAPRPEKVEV